MVRTCSTVCYVIARDYQRGNAHSLKQLDARLSLGIGYIAVCCFHTTERHMREHVSHTPLKKHVSVFFLTSALRSSQGNYLCKRPALGFCPRPIAPDLHR